MDNDNVVLFPVGRMVWGDLYEGQTQNMEGKKYTKDDGTPYKMYQFGVAIPKEGKGHWGVTTEWGKVLWRVGHSRLKNAGSMGHNFSWKVQDGDSTQANQKGKINAEKEGYPGHWIVAFSSTYPCKLARLEDDGRVSAYPDEGGILPGYWVEVKASFGDNGNTLKPGVYVNPMGLCLIGIDKRIVTGESVESMGFGQRARPAYVPSGAAGSDTPPPPGTGTARATTPHTAILKGGASDDTPPPPGDDEDMPPPPSDGPTPTDKAKGKSYDKWLESGWKHEQLIKHGIFTE